MDVSEKVLEIFPSLKEKTKIDLTGKATIHANYNGPLRSRLRGRHYVE